MIFKLPVIIVSLFAVFIHCFCLADGVTNPSILSDKRAVSRAVALYTESSADRLKPYFDDAGVDYPPQKIALLAVKDTRRLELWAEKDNNWVFIKKYNVLATSGVSGPKLIEGDKQIPEGIYRIIRLNPYSQYHLSMKLNYPNRFDLKWARKENRSNPGSNIFIHGKSESIGCLAIGDRAIEELFVLVHDVSKYNVKVIISPTDPRTSSLVPPAGSKPWIGELYKNITREFLEVSGGESEYTPQPDSKKSANIPASTEAEDE